MSLIRFGSKRSGGSWLRKAPRRRHAAQRRFGFSETLEARQVLSADGLSLLLDGPDPIEDVKGPITPPADSGLLPLDQTFLLASKPDSDFTIYLDFTGHVTADAAWDAALFASGNPRFGQPFTTPQFSIDADIFNFSTQELETIQEVYMRVAEDFAPFDVNVTTIEPNIEDLRLTEDGDTRYGMRVAIGGSTFDWYLPPTGNLGGAGGVALLNSFQAEVDRPTYVFQEAGFGNPDNIALAASHEVGHTLGLIHDGDITIPVFDPDDPQNPGMREYYPGHANGVWGPIMGAPFGVGVSQWSRGEYELAWNDLTGNEPPPGVVVVDDEIPPLILFTFDEEGELIVDEETGAPILETVPRYIQDDLGQITSNGFGYRADDHANEPFVDDPVDGRMELASEFPVFDTEIDIATGFGLIETNTDIDYFQFTTDGGDITINANPNSFGANLDIKLELYDSEGVLIETAAPDFDLTATLALQNQPAGLYYVSVTGDGFREVFQEFELQTAGYTDYGSLGRYTLEVNADLGAIPDAFEINDTFEQAVDLPLGDFIAMDLSIHDDDDQDFFKWTAAADGQLTVSADFLNSEGNVELFVYAENQVDILARSIGTDDGETVTLLDVEAGDVYFILLNGRDGATQEDYTLQINGPGLLPDQFEVNNTPETATVIDEAVFSADVSIHVTGDVDYYLWQAASDGLFEVEAVYQAAGPDLVIEVFKDDVLVATSTAIDDGINNGQEVELAVFTGDVLTIRVRVPDDAEPGLNITPYTISFDGTGVLGDPLEPNDINNPTPITTTSALFNRVSIHTLNDRDFFVYTPPEDGQLEVSLEFLHAFGDLDVRVTEQASGQFVALGSSITNDEALLFNVQGGVAYLIETYGFEGDLVPVYALRTSFIAGIPDPADLNDDGLVNDDDRLFWASQYGSTGVDLRADLNSDGVVNAADYTVWRDLASGTAGGSSSAAAASGIPAYTEPAAASIETEFSPAVSEPAGFVIDPIVVDRRQPFIAPARTAITETSLELLLAYEQGKSDEDLADEESAVVSSHDSEEQQLAELDAAFGLSI